MYFWKNLWKIKKKSNGKKSGGIFEGTGEITKDNQEEISGAIYAKPIQEISKNTLLAG